MFKNYTDATNEMSLYDKLMMSTSLSDIRPLGSKTFRQMTTISNPILLGMLLIACGGGGGGSSPAKKSTPPDDDKMMPGPDPTPDTDYVAPTGLFLQFEDKDVYSDGETYSLDENEKPVEGTDVGVLPEESDGSGNAIDLNATFRSTDFIDETEADENNDGIITTYAYRLADNPDGYNNDLFSINDDNALHFIGPNSGDFEAETRPTYKLKVQVIQLDAKAITTEADVAVFELETADGTQYGYSGGTITKQDKEVVEGVEYKAAVEAVEAVVAVASWVTLGTTNTVTFTADTAGVAGDSLIVAYDDGGAAGTGVVLTFSGSTLTITYETTNTIANLVTAFASASTDITSRFDLTMAGDDATTLDLVFGADGSSQLANGVDEVVAVEASPEVLAVEEVGYQVEFPAAAATATVANGADNLFVITAKTAGVAFNNLNINFAAFSASSTTGDPVIAYSTSSGVTISYGANPGVPTVDALIALIKANTTSLTIGGETGTFSEFFDIEAHGDIDSSTYNAYNFRDTAGTGTLTGGMDGTTELHSDRTIEVTAGKIYLFDGEISFEAYTTPEGTTIEEDSYVIVVPTTAGNGEVRVVTQAELDALTGTTYYIIGEVEAPGIAVAAFLEKENTGETASITFTAINAGADGNGSVNFSFANTTTADANIVLSVATNGTIIITYGANATLADLKMALEATTGDNATVAAEIAKLVTFSITGTDTETLANTLGDVSGSTPDTLAGGSGGPLPTKAGDETPDLVLVKETDTDTEYDYTITLFNVDDNAPAFADATPSVAEDLVGGKDSAVIFTATATDADNVGEDEEKFTETITYKLGANNEYDNNLFIIDEATGEVRLAAGATLDFETKQTYQVEITATSTSTLGNGSTKQTTKIFDITVTDVNEDPIGTAVDYAADFADSTTVGTLIAADEDTGETFSYELVQDTPPPAPTATEGVPSDGEETTDTALFEITVEDGVYTLKFKNAEADAAGEGGRGDVGTTYTVRVSVTDSGGEITIQIITITEGTLQVGGQNSGYLDALNDGLLLENEYFASLGPITGGRTIALSAPITTSTYEAITTTGDGTAITGVDATAGIVNIKSTADYDTVTIVFVVGDSTASTGSADVTLNVDDPLNPIITFTTADAAITQAYVATAISGASAAIQAILDTPAAGTWSISADTTLTTDQISGPRDNDNADFFILNEDPDLFILDENPDTFTLDENPTTFTLTQTDATLKYTTGIEAAGATIALDASTQGGHFVVLNTARNGFELKATLATGDFAIARLNADGDALIYAPGLVLGGLTLDINSAGTIIAVTGVVADGAVPTFAGVTINIHDGKFETHIYGADIAAAIAVDTSADGGKFVVLDADYNGFSLKAELEEGDYAVARLNADATAITKLADFVPTLTYTDDGAGTITIVVGNVAAGDNVQKFDNVLINIDDGGFTLHDFGANIEDDIAVVAATHGGYFVVLDTDYDGFTLKETLAEGDIAIARLNADATAIITASGLDIGGITLALNGAGDAIEVGGDIAGNDVLTFNAVTINIDDGKFQTQTYATGIDAAITVAANSGGHFVVLDEDYAGFTIKAALAKGDFVVGRISADATSVIALEDIGITFTLNAAGNSIAVGGIAVGDVVPTFGDTLLYVGGNSGDFEAPDSELTVQFVIAEDVVTTTAAYTLATALVAADANKEVYLVAVGNTPTLMLRDAGDGPDTSWAGSYRVGTVNADGTAVLGAGDVADSAWTGGASASLASGTIIVDGIETYVVELSNVDEAPNFVNADGDVITTLEVDVNENEGTGTEETGFAATLTANDPEGAARLIYSIDGGADADKFNIDRNTGELSFKEAPNHEAPGSAADPASNTYIVNVKVNADNDPSSASTITVTINVKDINDVPPTITLSDSDLSISENGVALSTNGLLTATATKDTDNSVVTWSIKEDENDDSASFNIDGSTGVVAFKTDTTPDYETNKDGYTFTIIATATDGDIVLTTEQVVTIGITNINDAPTLDTATPSLTVAEGETFVLTDANLLTTDQDEADTAGEITYTLTAAPTNGKLQKLESGTWTDLAATTGTFTQADITAGNVQYVHDGGETTTDTFTFTVDDGNEDNSAPATQTFSITITAVNDAPVINEDDDADDGAIAIDLAGGIAEITKIIATDAENSALTYSVDDTTNFAIDANGTLSFVTAPAYDGTVGADNIRSVTVTVSDAATGGLTDTVVVTITTIDGTPPTVDSASTGTAQDEGTIAASTLVYTAMATPDTTGKTITWTLEGVDKDSFSIDSDGKVTVTSELMPNHDAGKTSYTFIVVATEADNPVVGKKTVTIAINDINDEAPSITSGDTGTALPENAEVTTTTAVYTAAGTADVAGDTIVWSLKDNKDASNNPTDDAPLFDIDTGTGAVTFKAATTPNLETNTDGYTFTVVATVTNADNTVQTAEQEVTVAVTNVNEAPILAIAIRGDDVVTEDTASDNSASGSLTIGDPDSDDDATTMKVFVGNTDNTAATITQEITIPATGSENVEITGLGAGITGSTNYGDFTFTRTSADGLVAWTFVLDDAAVQSLGEGETATAKVWVLITDDGDADGSNPLSSEVKEISVTITGKNDAPTLTADSGGDTAVLEDADNDDAAGSVTATDADMTDMLTLSGRVGSGGYTAADADGENIVGTYGTFTLNSAGAWTYVLNDSHADVQALNTNDTLMDTLTIRVADDATTPAMDTETINVIITGTNDAPVINEATSATNAGATDNSNDGVIAVNVPNGRAEITTIVATDVDNVDSTLRYSVTDADYVINEMTGALSFASAPSFDSTPAANNTKSVVVTVTDGTDTDTVTVNITIIAGDAPTFGGAPTNHGPFAEETPIAANTPIYTTSATADSKSGGSVEWSLTGADASLFEITGGVVTFKAATTPQADMVGSTAGRTSYEFNVIATDSVTGASALQAVSIAVTDINDVAPVITSGATGTALIDGTEVPTTETIYTAAGDADVGAISWSLESGTGDEAILSIDSTSGAVTFKVATTPQADGTNAKTSYTFTVIATTSDSDGMTNVKTATQAVSIAVTDTNDEKPVFTSDTTTATTYDENMEIASGTTVYTAAATTDTGGTIAWSLVDAANSMFTINSSTGVVTLNTAFTPDFETPTTFTVIATVTADSISQTEQQTVTLSVKDLNDAPTVSYAVTGNALVENGNTYSTGNTITIGDVDGGQDASNLTVFLGNTEANSQGSTTSNNHSGPLAKGTSRSIQALQDAADGPAAYGSFNFTRAADGSITWQFSLQHAAVQRLDEGEEAFASAWITVGDGTASTTEEIRIKITGANDGPNVSLAGGGDYNVAEDTANDNAGGALNITDPDDGDTEMNMGVFIGNTDGTAANITTALALNVSGQTIASSGSSAVSGVASGNYGDFTFARAANGKVTWTFVLDDSKVQNLGVGEVAYADVWVKITDSESANDVQRIRVTITGTNDAPSVTTIGAIRPDVMEDGFHILTMTDLNTTDIDDAPSGITYTLNSVPANGTLQINVSSTSTADWVALTNSQFTQADINDGKVRYLHNGDETKNTDAFQLSVDDGNEDSTTALTVNFAIDITLTNDAPTITETGTPDKSVTEDSDATASGAVTIDDVDNDNSSLTITGKVGSGAAVAADADGENITGTYGTFTLTSAGAWTYRVNNSNTAVQALNDGDTLTDTLTISVSDGAITTTQDIVVTINGANENTPPTVDTNSGLSVGEGSFADLKGALASSDAEDTDSTLTYEVVSTGLGGSFEIKGTSGGNTTWTTVTSFTQAQIDASEIRYVRTLTTENFNADEVITARLKVKDSDDGETADFDFTITVTPVNDDAPSFVAGDVTYPTENAQGQNGEGVGIVEFTITDDDGKDGMGSDYAVGDFSITGTGASKFTFEVNDTDPNKFILKVKDNAPLDYEDGSSYSLTIGLSDGVNGDPSGIVITFDVVDVNDVAPTINGGANAVATALPENTEVANTKVVYEARGTADVGTIVWSIEESNSPFMIDSSGDVRFKTTFTPDHENTASYTFTVVATVGTLATKQTVTLAITDVNDVAPTISGGANAVATALPENTEVANTKVVYEARGTADVGTIVWSIEESNSPFMIDSSGDVRFKTTFTPDHENTASYTFTVVATVGTLATKQTVTLAITDVNDVAPTISGGANAVATALPENTEVANTKVVYEARGTADVGTIVWSIEESNSPFMIDSSGDVRFKTTFTPDHENTASYTFTVVATVGTLATKQTVTLAVGNVNEDGSQTAITGSSANPGFAVTGDTLTAGDVTDPDAVTTANPTGTVTSGLTYEWQTRADSSSAWTLGVGTGRTLSTTMLPVGTQIRLMTSYSGFGTGSFTSETITIDTPATGAVWITWDAGDKPEVATELTADITGVSDADDSTLDAAYVWLKDGTVIDAATSSTYTPLSDGAGDYSVKVTFTDSVTGRTYEITSSVQTIYAADAETSSGDVLGGEVVSLNLFGDGAANYIKVPGTTTGNDAIISGDTDNTKYLLQGNVGHDRLIGGDGDDVLIGGRGDDTITSGTGADTVIYRYKDIDKSMGVRAFDGPDTILGHERGADTLAFVYINPNASKKDDAYHGVNAEDWEANFLSRTDITLVRENASDTSIELRIEFNQPPSGRAGIYSPKVGGAANFVTVEFDSGSSATLNTMWDSIFAARTGGANSDTTTDNTLTINEEAQFDQIFGANFLTFTNEDDLGSSDIIVF